MLQRPLIGLTLVLGVTSSLFACSSENTTEAPKNDAAACEDYSGVWKINACLIKTCTIAQSGCDVTFNCDPFLGPVITATGTASNKDVTFDSSSVTCVIATAGNGLTGTCTNDAGQCQFNGTRE
ncbi:MAG: hypothetical protein IPI67_33945 [Myxococcales bacterium]|nr:hypothetical protein [Myxococcales bacterium]